MNRSWWLRPLTWTVAVLFLALPVIGALNGWFAADRWPLRRLNVQAQFNQVRAEDVRIAIAPHLTEGFFAVQLAEIKKSVEQMPWVESVVVRKRWPDEIVVNLVERIAYANWGENRLLSTKGDIFMAQTNFDASQLPHFAGPADRTKEVMAFYQSGVELLAPIQLRPRAVEMNARGAWRIILLDGVEILVGREQAIQRIERFASVFPRAQTIAESKKLKSVDLRYPNGFALSWDAPASAGIGEVEQNQIEQLSAPNVLPLDAPVNQTEIKPIPRPETALMNAHSAIFFRFDLFITRLAISVFQPSEMHA